MSTAPELPPSTPRKRFRAQIRDEIKQAALRQLAASGPAGVSVNAIGKELGVSGPALYRYFSSRDELLTELVIDAYRDLAASLRDVIDETPNQPTRRRFGTFARTYRGWALAQPHRYQLLFGPPLPGYDAHAERLIEAAQALMDLLIRTLPAPSNTLRPTKPLAAELTRWANARGAQVDPSTALHAVLTWSHMHGFVSLEIAGNYASMNIDPNELFEAELIRLTS
ncbi:MAG: TetR/AcrR family transcriptional regulator [Solirubrobacteraceae bacterium]